jgi:tetratricopeptide (TPR) repeat protein
VAALTGQLDKVARARAAAAKGRWAEAAALWRQVVERNPVNGTYWDQLARACWRLEDHSGALAAYGKVLELGASDLDEPEAVFPSEIAYRIACCHARLGGDDEAVQALGRAFELGFRDLERARADDHLGALRQSRRLDSLLGPPAGALPIAGAEPLGVTAGDQPTGGGALSTGDALPTTGDGGGEDRDAGWRGDLALLAREVKRRAWSPFRLLPEPDFDAAVAELDRSIPRLDDTRVAIEMMKLLAPLGDGHAFVRFPDDDPRSHHGLPLQFYLFEEGLFVTAADDRHAELLGAQVLAIGGHQLDQVMAALDPLISRDNQWWPRHVAPMLLRQAPLLHGLGLAPDPGAVPLTLRPPGGQPAEVTVDADSAWSSRGAFVPCPPGWRFLPETLSAPLPLYLRNCGALYWFEHLPEAEAVYFQLNNVLDDPGEPLAAFAQRLLAFVEDHPVAKLVVDLRWNGGGNTLLVMPLLHGLIADRKINRRGRLFVIAGRGTFSAAQNTATFIDRHTEAIFVGEPTGSRPNFVGETAPFRLPYSGLLANVSDLYWQTSWPMDQRAWIPPELYTPPTFEAFSANRDPAMEAILACREHLPGW